MKVTLLQSNLVWESRKANIVAFEKQIFSLNQATDLIILPEMFTSGFSMQPHLWAEEHLGPSFQKMQIWAQKTQAAILGSLIIKEHNQYFNRAYFVFPNGTYQFYDKRHLFRMAKEDKFYSSGSNRIIVEYKSWKILPLICYDLRFPVWSRNDVNYDLLIYIANWPERRALPWKTLLKARAIENLSYVVGVNRIGKDGNGISHSGDSAVIDYKGDVISHILPNQPQAETVYLSKSKLSDFKTKFPVHLDADTFSINKN